MSSSRVSCLRMLCRLCACVLAPLVRTALVVKPIPRNLAGKCGIIAHDEVDFELVRFTKMRYSGACQTLEGRGAALAGDPRTVSQMKLREVLEGRRAAAAGLLKVLAPMTARRLHAHQHRGRHCPIARFVVWNSFGVHGFGSQLQSLRIGLEYGLRTNRIVVQNPQFEAHIVQEDLKLRFADHAGASSSSGNATESAGEASKAGQQQGGGGGLYWDNIQSDLGEMGKLSECDDQVLKWVSESTYAPLTRWQQQGSGATSTPVLEQVVETSDEDLQPNNLLQLHPVKYGKTVRSGLVRPPAELIRSLLYDRYFEEEAPQLLPTDTGPNPDVAAEAGAGERYVLVGDEEEPEGVRADDTEWQGRDIYW